MTAALRPAGLWPSTLSAGGVVLGLGFAALAAPTLVSLADQTWSKEFGAYGPIVLVTGLWLLWRQAPELKRFGVAGGPWITAAILAPSLVAYVFGRSYDFVTLEVGGVYGVGLAVLQARFGARILIAHWF